VVTSAKASRAVSIARALTSTSYYIPVKTVSEMNSRGHWSVRARRFKKQRQIVSMILGQNIGNKWGWPPFSVKLVRVAPSKGLDDDNLRSSGKAVRDQIAEALGIDDGSSRITWIYDQRRGKPGEYALELTIQGQSKP
jgi:hypothetical protein